MENKINEKIKDNHSTGRGHDVENRHEEQTDRRLRELYDAETGILEAALLKAAGKSSWEEFPRESEAKIQEGYDRLVARLREKGEYRETLPENRNTEKLKQIQEVKENFDGCQNEWNRTHRFLKPAAAVAAAAMFTALVGMTIIADSESWYTPVNSEETSFPEKK